MSQPDYKIKKMVGAYNDNTRQQAIQNKRISVSSRPDSDLASQNDRTIEEETSVARLVDSNKIRRLKDATT